MPRTSRAVAPTGVSGFIGSPLPSPARGRGSAASLDELRVGELRHVGQLLDDSRLHQQLARLLAEGRVLAGEELLVGGAVLPAQVLLAALERIAGLLDVGTHDLEAL